MTVKPKAFAVDDQPSGTTTGKSSKWITHTKRIVLESIQQVVVCLGRTVLPSGSIVDVLEQASGLGAPVVAVDSDDTVPVVTVVVLARAVDVASEPVAGVGHLLQPAVAAAAVVNDFLPAAHVGSVRSAVSDGDGDAGY